MLTFENYPINKTHVPSFLLKNLSETLRTVYANKFSFKNFNLVIWKKKILTFVFNFQKARLTIYFLK